MIERRKNPRYKTHVPVEIHAEGNPAPMRCVTADLSLDGCYIESMIPFPAGTRLDLKLEASDTLLISAKVVTCDPQVGNGIEFMRMLDEDYVTLQKFLEQVAQEQMAEKP